MLANSAFLFTKSFTACIASQHVVTCVAKKLILVFPNSLKSFHFRILLSAIIFLSSCLVSLDFPLPYNRSLFRLLISAPRAFATLIGSILESSLAESSELECVSLELTFAAKYRNCTDQVPVIHLYRYYKFEPARMRAPTLNQCFYADRWSVQFLYLAASELTLAAILKTSTHGYR